MDTCQTVVAFDIDWKVWSSRWKTKTELRRKSRIPGLAEPSFATGGPSDQIFECRSRNQLQALLDAV